MSRKVRLISSSLTIFFLFSGRTTLIIAHRLSTIRNADIIGVMLRGKLVEVERKIFVFLFFSHRSHSRWVHMMI